MPTPPCPSSVKAAAILLLVVGAQLLLISAIAVMVIIAVAVVNSGGGCGYLVMFALPLSLGVGLVKIAATTLWGTTGSVRNNGIFCVSLGGLGCVLCLLGVDSGLRNGVFNRPPALDEVAIGFAASVLFLLNSAALLTAGFMLVRSRARYAAWRRACAEWPDDSAADD